MSPAQQFWHLANFLGPALVSGAIAAVLAKLIWHHQLSAVSWWRLVAWAVAAGEIAMLAGLAATGRDGTMAAYGAMVAGIALAIWFTGFWPFRPRGS